MWVRMDETGAVFSWSTHLSGQTAFEQVVRPVALWRGGEAEISLFQEIEETELNGVKEGEDQDVRRSRWRS